MTVYSVWPYFAIVGLILFIFSTRLFGFLDSVSASEHDRSTNLDGIRGILALSVMINHAIVTHRWLLTGQWEIPPAPFYDQLGSLAVAVFFMITGFLFWGKMIANRGEPNFATLYISRLFRIAPVYLVTIAAMTLIVLHRTGFVLHEPISVLVIKLLQWSALGLLGGPDFNGYASVWIILAGVTWTLRYEWYFYFSLLLISRLSVKRSATIFPLLIIASCFLCSIRWPARDWFLAALFAVGMTISSITQKSPIRRGGNGSSLAALVLLGSIFVGWDTPFGTLQVLLAGMFFYLICSGTSIFGLLRTKAAQRLGHVSYSIYLLQGPVMTVLFALPEVRLFSLASNNAYWCIVAACALILASISSCTYMLIERPGIEFGRRIARGMRSTSTTVKAHQPSI